MCSLNITPCHTGATNWRCWVLYLHCRVSYIFTEPVRRPTKYYKIDVGLLTTRPVLTSSYIVDTFLIQAYLNNNTVTGTVTSL